MLCRNDGSLKQADGIDCEMSLLNKDLWQQFRSLETEMIITKSGRRMFPTLRVQVSNLDPNSLYCVLLEMSSCTDIRYKYTGGKGWQSAGTGEAQSPTRMYMHPDSPSKGSQWMNTSLSFGRLKLTNVSTAPIGHIVLNSMHRYQPKIIIVKANDTRTLAWAPSSAFVFPETEFMAVTAYQNDKITKLKIDNNPFAKGFREDGHAKSKRKRTYLDTTEIDVETIDDCSHNNHDKAEIVSSSRTVVSLDKQNVLESNKNGAICISWKPSYWSNNAYYDFHRSYSQVEAYRYIPHYPYYSYPNPYLPTHMVNHQAQDLSIAPKRRKLTDFSIRAIVES